MKGVGGGAAKFKDKAIIFESGAKEGFEKIKKKHFRNSKVHLRTHVGLRRRPALAGAEGMPTRQARVLWNIRALGYATRIS